MSYTPFAVDRKALTIMGVPFPDIETLESIARGIGTNMFEGFVPAPRKVEIIRDFCLNKITPEEMLKAVIESSHEK